MPEKTNTRSCAEGTESQAIKHTFLFMFSLHISWRRNHQIFLHAQVLQCSQNFCTISCLIQCKHWLGIHGHRGSCRILRSLLWYQWGHELLWFFNDFADSFNFINPPTKPMLHHVAIVSLELRACIADCKAPKPQAFGVSLPRFFHHKFVTFWWRFFISFPGLLQLSSAVKAKDIKASTTFCPSAWGGRHRFLRRKIVGLDKP